MKMNSQPTYEVLKFNKNDCPPSIFRNSQPTYEVLKWDKLYRACNHHNRIPSLPMRYWNNTKNMKRFLNFIIIPSLPMRYWNLVIQLMKWVREKQFPAYLWGIEIHLPHQFCNTCPEFPAYLWGIEIYSK